LLSVSIPLVYADPLLPPARAQSDDTYNAIEATNSSADFKAGFSNIGPTLCQLVPARNGERKPAIQTLEHLSITRDDWLPSKMPQLTGSVPSDYDWKNFKAGMKGER
jgi:hypothetical protein